MKIKTLKDKEQSTYVWYSIRERLAFQSLCDHTGYLLTNVSDEEGYDSWDVIYKNGLNHIMGEIKVRKRFSDQFDGQRWIFEKKKFDEMKKIADGVEARRACLQPKFIVFFFDKIAIWNVEDIKEEDFFLEDLKANSVTGSEARRDKMITHLSLANAEIIDFKLDYDELKINAKQVFKYRYPNNYNDIKDL